VFLHVLGEEGLRRPGGGGLRGRLSQ
jgi:hypothetical protein